NPVRDATPAGRIRPIMGFGRVWGNYVDVRTALGWAVSPEQSFSLVIYPVSTRFFVLNHPLVSHRIQVDGAAWAYTDAPVPTAYPPPTSQPPTPNPVPGQIEVWATFQQFENGFMTWHGDSGTIFVYYGLNGGSATAFQSTTYGNLLDNRYGYPPPGRVNPIMGFGKVWGNFTEVRERLGWAVAPERGYTMLVRSQGSGFTFSLPDGQQVSNDYFTAWHFLSGSLPVYPPIAPSPTPQPPVIGDPVQTSAAFQQYEHGFMIWRQDSQAVIVFFDNGTAILYPLDQYLPLADNPFNGTPPPGMYKPVNAFGKVWGNFPLARDLGWGTMPEQGYTLVTRTVSNGSGIYMVLPDGRSLFYAVSGTWNYASP
ncbi:MAG: hypothetical protein K8I60_04930, partial [Anaerolineae bacterium]|nr:hypothetical protein [Anaerolineae bacterium]